MKLPVKPVSSAAAALFLAAALAANAQAPSAAPSSKAQGGAATSGAPASADIPAMPENSENLKKTDRLPRNALLPGNPEVTYVITPRARDDEDVPIVRGCWAKLYDEDGLKGDSVTIYGPIGIADAAGAGVFDIDWKDRISSISVGPAAKVSIYDNNDYRDLLLTVQPGQKADINNALKNFDAIKSLKVECNRKAKRKQEAAGNAAPSAR
jgi:hypothetical protein